MKKIVNKFRISTAMFALLLVIVCSVAMFNIGSQKVFALNDKQFVETGSISDELFANTMSKYRTNSTRESEGFGGWIYDNQFAGVWYDDNYNLNIGLIAEKASKTDLYSDSVVYHERKFSYNFLIEIHKELDKLMPKFTIFSVGIMPQHNQVEVILEDESQIISIINHLSSLALYSKEAIRFVIDKMPTPINTPIHGGGGITSSAGGGTISAKAICNVTGRAGIVTNAHVAEAGMQNFMERGSNNIIAAERAQWLMSGIADTAFVPFENQNNWFMDSSASWLNNPTENYWSNNAKDFILAPSTYQVAGRGEIVVGPVVKFGQTSGRTEGKITAISVSVNVGYATGTVKLTDQLRTNVRSLPGDSGSPLFYTNGGRLRLVGTIFSSTFHIGGNTSHASMITNVVEALNVTIMTDSIYTTSTSGLSSSQIAITGTARNLVGNVRLPNSINDGTTTRTATQIRNAAFQEHIGMSQITIPASIVELGTNAFHSNTRVDWQGNYSFRDNEFIKYVGSGTSFIIPSTIAGKTITSIAPNAFSNLTTLSQITIPESIKEIGKNAFFNTARWNNTPNNRIVYVDNWAVGYKGIINELNLENEIVGIADYAFENLDIDKLVIPDSVTEVGFAAFKNCRNITSITIPFIGYSLANTSMDKSHLGYIFGVDSPFDQAIYIPTMLTDITITKAKYIKDYAFRGCNQIRNISLPNTLSSIGVQVFDDCINLEEIAIDENNQDYFCQNGILYYRLKSRLKSLIFSVPQAIKGNVVLPDNVEYINGSFTDRYNLESIVIPNSVSWIALGSFQGCNNLYSITLPFIGYSIYNNVYRQHFGYIFGASNSTNQNNYVPVSLKEVIITGVEQNDSYVFKRVDSINNYAFNGCDSITSVYIPSSIKSIGVGAFENCSSLQTVIFDGATLLHENSFENPTRFIVTSCEFKKYYEQYFNIFCNIIDCSCGFLMKIDSVSLLEIQGTILHGSISVNDIITLATNDSSRLSAIVSAEALYVNNQEVNCAVAGENIKLLFSFNKLRLKKTFATRCDNLHNKISELKITDYDYQGQYFFDELTNSYDLTDLTISTKRLRTGYIEKEYIVLSPRRANAGVAYLEYNFSKPIRFITVDIALWSAKENLNRLDCTAVFQYKDKNGNWVTKLDLLNDVELTVDRSSPNTYTILFDEPVTDFRFYLTSPAVGSSNSGRLCTGNMFINYV